MTLATATRCLAKLLPSQINNPHLKLRTAKQADPAIAH